jgi:hypothetical protein
MYAHQIRTEVRTVFENSSTVFSYEAKTTFVRETNVI